MCVTRGKEATAVFNSDRAAKATAGLKPQIVNAADGESEGEGGFGLTWLRSGSVWAGTGFGNHNSSVMV